MKKKTVVIVFETYDRGKYYFEDYILPLIGEVDTITRYQYENENIKVFIKSLKQPNNLIGLYADFVILENNNNIDFFENIIMPIVKYDRSKINVVL